MNDCFIRMWGIPPEVAASGDAKRMAEFVLPQVVDPEGFLDSTGKNSWDFRAPDNRDIIHLKDGRVFERLTTQFKVAGRLAGRTVTTRDLTPHYEVLTELSRARDEALDAARIKAQFLASVSHELRTPLNAIVGATGLLSGQLDQEQGSTPCFPNGPPCWGRSRS
jgi:signal transduction histidine kinase